jgi:hypothetical protein
MAAGCHTAALRAMLLSYQEAFGVLLPKAGTVLDMGRILTHQTIVVERPWAKQPLRRWRGVFSMRPRGEQASSHLPEHLAV